MNRTPAARSRRAMVVARSWRAAAAAVAGVLVLAAAGCGVPSSGSPVVDGTVSANGGSGGGGSSAGPPGPSAFGDDASPQEFVEGYLSALAGLPSTVTTTDEVAAAQAWFKVDPCQATRVTGCQQPWQPSTTILVIRAPVNGWVPTHVGLATDVTGTAQVLGTFTPATGVLQPLQPGPYSSLPLTFTVVPNDSNAAGHWRLNNPPPYLLMSEDALSAAYTAHPVYFWNADRTVLIPDIRYLPNPLPPLRKATQIIDWVLGGGLSGSLAPGATLVDPIVRVADPPHANRYVVNLTAGARGSDDQALYLLCYQLQWSLGTITADGSDSVPSEVQLQIDGQDGPLSADQGYRENVPNLRSTRSYLPAPTFGIAGGVVTEFDMGQGVKPSAERLAASDQPPVLNSKLNANVTLAAVDGTRTAAALVKHNASTGGDDLWVRWFSKGVTSDFQKVSGLPPAGKMLRPQFIVQPGKGGSPAAVVADGGHLYVVAPSAQPTPKPINTSAAGTITAFSIAPDAHRVAYVSAGKVYVSVLQNSSGSMTLPQGSMLNTEPGTRQLPDSETAAPVGLESASQVVWSAVDKILVAGRHGSSAGMVDEFSADGSSAREVTDLGASPIVMLTSYVYDPLRFPPSGDNMMVQIPRFAYWGRNQVLLEFDESGHLADLSAPFFQD